MIKFISGGVCAPQGFTAAGIHCGIRKNKVKKDLALIKCDTSAAAAAVYTQNLVQGAPILVTKSNLKDGRAAAMICNSGIANTCCADGMEKAAGMCEIAGEALGIPASDIIVASTGVIGQPLDLAPIADNIGLLVSELSAEGGHAAAEAIMTTDTVAKEFAVVADIGDYQIKIGGIAKGSGMINPKMATMLSFITTDAEIDPELLQIAIKSAADISFNRVSIDGDTSTNDMLSIMASGKSGVRITAQSGFKSFCEALNILCITLARSLAKDGEGATKLLECNVTGAPDISVAETVSDSVINSPLVKTAMFGTDANWGRILCAIGYAGCELDIALIKVSLKSAAGEIEVFSAGCGADIDEELALTILKADEIMINVDLGLGYAEATAWGCDLSYDYVKINGDYRT